MLESLPKRHRTELVACLQRAERLLRAATITIGVVDPESEPATWALSQYFAEPDRRFPTGFDVAGAGAGHDSDLMRAPWACSWCCATMARSLAVAGCSESIRQLVRSSECGSTTIGEDWASVAACCVPRNSCQRTEPDSPRHEQLTERGHRDVPTIRLRSRGEVQRQPLRPSLVCEAVDHDCRAGTVGRAGLGPR